MADPASNPSQLFFSLLTLIMIFVDFISCFLGIFMILEICFIEFNMI